MHRDKIYIAEIVSVTGSSDDPKCDKIGGHRVTLSDPSFLMQHYSGKIAK